MPITDGGDWLLSSPNLAQAALCAANNFQGIDAATAISLISHHDHPLDNYTTAR
jgi:hypothetical protein